MNKKTPCHTYVVIVDLFMSWMSVYKETKAEGLIKVLRYHFVIHEAPEEIATDGGQTCLLYANLMWHMGPGPKMYIGPCPIPSMGPDLFNT